eukprot:3457253-Pyramimonas_sp.AAC.1
MPSGHRHRGRVGRTKLAGRGAREHAQASAAAEMHQPTPSTHRTRYSQIAGGWWADCASSGV